LPNLYQGALHGQQYFIGCRGFNRGFDKGHQSHSFPDNVDEQILVKLLANQPLSDTSEKESQPQQLCRMPVLYSPLPEIVPIFRSPAHAHISTGATSRDHRESRETLSLKHRRVPWLQRHVNATLLVYLHSVWKTIYIGKLTVTRRGRMAQTQRQ
jgi:hypothetical protein